MADPTLLATADAEHPAVARWRCGGALRGVGRCLTAWGGANLYRLRSLFH